MISEAEKQKLKEHPLYPEAEIVVEGLKKDILKQLKDKISGRGRE